MQYPPPDDPAFCRPTHRGPGGWRGYSLLGAMLAVLLLMQCSGCQQTPLYRLPANKTGYRLPPCSATVTPGTPCAPHVVESKISACEKRFGKKLCDQGKPRE